MDVFPDKNIKKRQFLTEIELPFRLELEGKELEIEKMKDFIGNLQRENENLKGRIEGLRYD